jgi:transketolase
MRKELCDALLRVVTRPDMIFLTGDLGFMALELLKEVMGKRFINGGVSEQNMISVAAAMACDGWQCWCYSIAPFIFARPFEQIRNDVCLHDLPVKIIGNGGGYGYGVMGPAHHAVEDYAVMLALPFMRVFVPAFNEDVAPVIEAAARQPHPAYIRLGKGELPPREMAPAYEPWRQLTDGYGPVIVVAGPLAGTAWAVARELPIETRPSLWVVSELPLDTTPPPSRFVAEVSRNGRLLVIEEHIRQGGLGAMLAHWLLESSVAIRAFRHLSAAGLAVGAYGSQAFLRQHSHLDPESIHTAILAMEER